MYGMVNNAIKQLIIENHDQEIWARVFRDSNLHSDDFIIGSNMKMQIL